MKNILYQEKNLLHLKNLSILILNYNSSDKIISQLKTLKNNELTNDNFIIVDNNSADAEVLKTYCLQNQFQFIQTHENKGYAFGNNVALKTAIANGKEYFLILNPDIEIYSNAINAMYNEITAHPNMGAVGCRICDKFQKDLIFSDGGLLFPDFGFRGGHLNGNKLINKVVVPKKINKIDYVNGSVFMFSKEALKQNGLMRNDFFMYYEESEWCYRLTNTTNLEMVILTNVIAYHENSVKGKLYHYYISRNRLWFCKLYNGNIKVAKKDILKEMKRSLFSKRNKTFLNFGLFFAILSGYRAGLKQTVALDNFEKI